MKRGFECNLSLPHSSETFDGGMSFPRLRWGNPFEKPVYELFPSHKIPVSPKRDHPMDLSGGFRLLVT